MSYDKSKAARLAHIEQHLAAGFTLANAESHIVNGTGNPHACVMHLAAHATAMAQRAWFAAGDLAASRQWWYTAARLNKHLYETAPAQVFPLAQMLDLLAPLLSNDRAIIDWFAHQEAMLDAGRAADPQESEFLTMTVLLAIQGAWDAVTQRSRQALATGSLTRRKVDYAHDFACLAALANRDAPAMVAALTEIVGQNQRAARHDFEGGYTAGLISTMASIYAKIAWHHGLAVEIRSPYVPSPWLPMTPAAEPKTPYAFLLSSGEVDATGRDQVLQAGTSGRRENTAEPLKSAAEIELLEALASRLQRHAPRRWKCIFMNCELRETTGGMSSSEDLFAVTRSLFGGVKRQEWALDADSILMLFELGRLTCSRARRPHVTIDLIIPRKGGHHAFADFEPLRRLGGGDRFFRGKHKVYRDIEPLLQLID